MKKAIIEVCCTHQGIDHSMWKVSCKESEIEGWLNTLSARFFRSPVQRATIYVTHVNGDRYSHEWSKGIKLA